MQPYPDWDSMEPHSPCHTFRTSQAFCIFPAAKKYFHFQGAVAVLCTLSREVLLGGQPERGSSRGLGVNTGARLGLEASVGMI